MIRASAKPITAVRSPSLAYVAFGSPRQRGFWGTTSGHFDANDNCTQRQGGPNKEIAPANDPHLTGPIDPIDQPAPSSYRYQHNADGLRTRKDRVSPSDPYGQAQDTRLYLYDQHHHRIAELDPRTGAIVSETVWLDEQPIAHYTRPTNALPTEQGSVLNPANGLKLYHIHNDHLGTPQVVTDAATNQIAWKATYDPYGKTTRVTGNGPNGTASIVFNLRQPGQYFESESGLYYNHHRDYDPGTGRYLQSDPIGLAGGINTYAYVGANPISFSDPMGLVTWSGTQIGGEFKAANAILFKLKSKCVLGERTYVEVLAIGGGLGLGADVSATVERADFEDGRVMPDPSAFNGRFFSAGASISFPASRASQNASILVTGKPAKWPGYGASAILLGEARSFGHNSVAGFSFGLGITYGRSTVINSWSEKCCESE